MGFWARPKFFAQRKIDDDGDMSAAMLLAATLWASAVDPAAPAGGVGPGLVPTPTVASAAALTTPEVWYGAPSAIADGAALTLVVSGMAVAGTTASRLTGTFAFFGVAAYMLSGPTVHLRYEHPGRAAASLALRALGLVGGAYFLLGHAYSHCNSDNGSDGPHCDAFSLGEILEVSLPFVAAAAMDDALLAHGTMPEAKAPPGRALTAIVGPGSVGFGGRC